MRSPGNERRRSLGCPGWDVDPGAFIDRVQDGVSGVIGANHHDGDVVEERQRRRIGACASSHLGEVRVGVSRIAGKRDQAAQRDKRREPSPVIALGATKAH